MNEENVLIRTEADFFNMGDTSTKKQPSDLVSDYMNSIADGKTFEDYLKGFDFQKQESLYNGIKKLVSAVALDLYLNEKKNQNKIINKLALKLANVEDATKKEKFLQTLSATLWVGYFAPRIRKRNHNQMFFKNPTDPILFKEASEELQDIYGFSDEDISKLQLFTMQVKCGLDYPASDIRVLYLWGGQYFGKTTLAKNIVAIANGQLVFRSEFSSHLSDELLTTKQGKLGLPKIAIYNCVLMDEAFYKNMGKTYADWKSLVTSEGGSYRLPYGQPIIWNGRANYVMTSNEPLQTFIQDFCDRRYLAIEFKNKPKQIEETDLTLLMHKFMTNADYPSGMTQKDFVHFVSGFSNVEGEFSAQRDDVLNVLLSDAFLYDLENRKQRQDYQLTLTGVMSIVDNIENSFKTHKIEKNVYKAAMIKAFGKPDDKNRWAVKKLIKDVQLAINTVK